MVNRHPVEAWKSGAGEPDAVELAMGTAAANLATADPAAAGIADAYALVIGVSAYQRVRTLPTVQDAQDVAAMLSDPARCGFPAANVRVLIEEAATRAAIVDALDELAERARPSSTVLVYFSGHGGAAPYAGAGTGEREAACCYLIPVDGRWGEPAELEATTLSGAELSRRLGAVAADRVTVILDCCHAAGLAEPRDIEPAPLGELTREAISPLASGRGRAVLAASRADGFAYVSAGQRNGVFTRHLLAGLGGGASRGGGVVRICDLFEYVQERVVAEQPGQRPVFKAELEENYPIARARVRRPMGTLPPPAPDGLPYDVFLTYARRDPEIRAWVERVLVPFLEGCGIKLCLEHRDFAETDQGADDPGGLLGLTYGLDRGRERGRSFSHGEQREHDRADQEVSWTDSSDDEVRGHSVGLAIASSRYTVAVLSPSYVDDDVDGLRAMVARHRLLEPGAPRLVPLLRQPCRVELDACMTSLIDLTHNRELLAGFQRLLLTLREPPRPRLDP
jgi:hypothetical protein